MYVICSLYVNMFMYILNKYVLSLKFKIPVPEPVVNHSCRARHEGGARKGGRAAWHANSSTSSCLLGCFANSIDILNKYLDNILNV